MRLRAASNGELDRPCAGAPPRRARVAEEAAFATPPAGPGSGTDAAADTSGLDSAKLINLPALRDNGGEPFWATVASTPNFFFAADSTRGDASTEAGPLAFCTNGFAAAILSSLASGLDEAPLDSFAGTFAGTPFDSLAFSAGTEDGVAETARS